MPTPSKRGPYRKRGLRLGQQLVISTTTDDYDLLDALARHNHVTLSRMVRQLLQPSLDKAKAGQSLDVHSVVTFPIPQVDVSYSINPPPQDPNTVTFLVRRMSGHNSLSGLECSRCQCIIVTFLRDGFSPPPQSAIDRVAAHSILCKGETHGQAESVVQTAQ